MKATRNCSIDGCGSVVLARGWCPKHYSRWRTHGDPNIVKRPPGAVDRFRSHYDVNSETGCWEWNGYRKPEPWAYGRILAHGRTMLAHRYAYETFIGPIPDGLVLDHLCRNPPCVNPAHLEAVTTRENTIERGMGQRALTYRERRCKRDHELTEDNIYSPPRNPAVRQCIKCRAIRTQKPRPRIDCGQCGQEVRKDKLGRHLKTHVRPGESPK